MAETSANEAEGTDTPPGSAITHSEHHDALSQPTETTDQSAETIEHTGAAPDFRARHNPFTALAALLRRVGRPPVLRVLGPLLLLIGVVAAITVFHDTQRGSVPNKQFTSVYAFVPEKLSKSALIPISLPTGIDENQARAGITFSPEIDGEWVVEDMVDTLVFKPKAPLREKVYYAVNMDVPGAQMSGDFYVDADPVVEAIFPARDSEVHESSEITIVFNRPMVPLTTLSVTDAMELPISITPKTAGRFKWISTRTLQFIPETTLVPSSLYTVEIKEGLVSIDGLPVAPFTHTFISRPLRYENISSGSIGYRSPIIIAFNQEVDLEKTKDYISVVRDDGQSVPIDVEYGKTTWYNWETDRSETTESPTLLAVYPQQDRHGREHFWDFERDYTLTITRAETKVGTIPLDESRTVQVHTPNIVENITASSERSALVRPELFDPQGTLTVQFYDEIDIRKLDFTVPGFKAVTYAKHCARDDQGIEIQKRGSCEQVDDKRTLVFTFNEDAFSIGQSFTLTLKKVYTTDGLKINSDPFLIPLHIYPAFNVTKTNPSSGDAAAPVDKITVCSNTPLRDLTEDETLSTLITTKGYIVYGNWYSSSYVDANEAWYSGPCANGEFETIIDYGLLPATPYTIDLTLTDAFGQTATEQRVFTTKEADSTYTRLHNLQQQYNVTRPERTKLTYAAENLETINLHICKMTPERFLYRTEEVYSNNQAPLDDECVAVKRDTIVLPPRYWVNNYFQVDLSNYFADTRGHYIVTLSSPLYTETVYDYRYQTDMYPYPQREVPVYDRTWVSVTNLAVGKKEVVYFEREDDAWSRSTNPATFSVLKNTLKQKTNLYWVTDSASLEPQSGVTITQFAGTSPGFVAVTDAQGIARPAVGSNILGAVARRGADTAVISDWSDELNYAQPAESASRTYIVTDRPIYRPGQTVYIRGIDRIGFDGSYEVWTKDPVPLTVSDSLGNVLYDTTLSVSKYGTFNTSFEIPADAPLGNYRIRAFGQETYVSVEEYVPAAFKLEAKTQKDEYTSGETIDIGVQADYYFGVPLDGGTVTYAVTAQDYYFDKYTDEYFNFGSDWYYCYSCGYGDEFLWRGEVKLDAQGHARIAWPANLSEYFDEDNRGSKVLTISITAKDQSGRSVSTQQSVVVHEADFYLGLQTSEYYASKNTPITLRVKTVDTRGTSVARNGLERVVYKVDWDTFKRQEVDGGFYYRSEEKLTEVTREKIETDRNGNWSGTLRFTESGQYKVVVLGTDDRGNRVETTAHLYIYGDTAVYVPPNNNYELDLAVERTHAAVGDTVSVLIKAPYERAKVLITAERGTIYDYWIVDVVGGLYEHTFTVKADYAPNVVVSALLVSGNPEVKFGSVNFSVDTDVNTLAVSVSSDKQQYVPGESVTLTVRTTNASGVGTPAEVSLAVADLSVLALRGNPKKDPRAYFYDGFPLAVSTASNLKNILYEAEIPLGSKGGGGADPDDLATKQRGVFKDTAYWNATLVTDAQGYGEVRFTLPDNLTTWRVESIAVTEDTKLGVDYLEFQTKKELMATPLKPRFVVPGDTFSLGAKIFNESTERETVTVTLASDSLEFLGDDRAEVAVGAGETETVYFPVRALKEKRLGSHAFTLTAKSSRGVDSVRQEIAITPNTVYETVATAHATKDDTVTEYLYIPPEVVSDEGGVTINANATLAVFMTDALTYMAQYPYGCSEQIASALSTIAMIHRALTVPGVVGDLNTIVDAHGVAHTVEAVVNAGLTRIYESQTAAGGIAYYKTLPPNLHLTMRVTLALQELKKAGFTVREDVLSRALSYIEQAAVLEYHAYPELNPDTVILAEYVLRTVGERTETRLTDIVVSFIKNKALLNEKLNNMSLAYLAILTARNFSAGDAARVYEVLTNRIDIDGRGAYLADPRGVAYGHFETPVANTALLLRAFVAHDDEHPLLPNVLRTLLKSRDDDGVWGSTQNTFMVVTALVEYLTWQHETEARFSLKALLDGVEVLAAKFTSDNIFDTVTRFIPMRELTKGKLLPLTFERTNELENETNFYYDLALRYYVPAASVPPRDEGITITRELFALDDTHGTTPLSRATVGDVVRGKLTIMVPDSYRDVAIEDIIPAGMEIVNFNLATEDQSLNENDASDDYYYDEYDDYYDNGGVGYVPTASSEGGLVTRTVDRLRSLFGAHQVARVSSANSENRFTSSFEQTLRPTHSESHDDRVFLFVDELSPGVYEYEYYLRALVPGEFQHLPAHAEELYFPEIFGRTSGGVFTITAD